MSDKIVVRIDASSLKESGCGLRFFLQTYKGYTPKGGTANDLVYGSAFHKGVETYDLTEGDKHKALQAGLEYWEANQEGIFVKDNSKHLNAAHLTVALTRYFSEVNTNPIFTDQQPLKIGESILVEQKFSIVIYEDDRIKILLQGTIDRLAEIKRTAAILIDDWKTSKAWDKDSFFEGFKCSPQLRTYVWALKRLAFMYPDGELGQLVKDKKIYACIHAAFLKSPIGVEFGRSQLIPFSSGDMEDFEILLMGAVSSLVRDIEDHLTTGKYPLPDGILNGNCQAPYGGMCKYFSVCSSLVGTPDNTDRVRLMTGLLNSKMDKREYRPLKFGGEGKLKDETNTQTENSNKG